MKRKRTRHYHLRDIYPVKYYRDEGFVEAKLEINEEDLPEIIEYYRGITPILTLMKSKLSTTGR